jgi:hypothetical protein
MPGCRDAGADALLEINPGTNDPLDIEIINIIKQRRASVSNRGFQLGRYSGF